MRGKGIQRCGHANQCGITPAHAGKSAMSVTPISESSDHPRTCGEKMCSAMEKDKATGSPPHMRGKEFFYPFTCIVSGITPAHAGKSGTVGTVGNAIGDHPRTCGEKISDKTVQVPEYGSPPHMRGKVALADLFKCHHGITPAHAGKSAFIIL